MKTKTITQMTNSEVIENNLRSGTDDYVRATNSDEIHRIIELGNQFQLACDIENDIETQKITEKSKADGFNLFL